MSHEQDAHTPLVVFTSLAIAGAGTLAWSMLAGHHTPEVRQLATWFGLTLLAAGLGASAWHLGRRERALLAARGLRRSPISHEGVLGTLTLIVGTLVCGGVLGAWTGAGIGTNVEGNTGTAIGFAASVATGLLAAAFLVSIGLVYRVGGQLTWGGFTVLMPLTSGLAFGAVLIDSWPPPHLVSSYTLGALAVDAFVFTQRWRRIAQVSLEHAGALGPGFDRRHEWLAARFLLVNALPCVSLFVWPTPLAALIAGAGLVVDRIAFYRLALQHRTELEIGRVERVLER